MSDIWHEWNERPVPSVDREIVVLTRWGDSINAVGYGFTESSDGCLEWLDPHGGLWHPVTGQKWAYASELMAKIQLTEATTE